MKTKAFLTAFCLFVFSAIGFTQNQDNDVKAKASNAVEKIDQSFKLEKSKRNSLSGIFADFYTGQQKLKNNIQRPASGLAQGLNRQDFQSVRKRNEALINERDNQLKKELTDEQYKKWKKDIEPVLHTPRRKK